MRSRCLYALVHGYIRHLSTSRSLSYTGGGIYPHKTNSCTALLLQHSHSLLSQCQLAIATQHRNTTTTTSSSSITRVLDGKDIAYMWQDEMAKDVARCVARYSRPPGLGVVLVGDRLDSHVYVMRKREACDRVGIMSKVVYLPGGEDVGQGEVCHAVDALCGDDAIDGVLVQLPLPKHIDEEEVIEHFDPSKDVDGFHPLNVGRTLMKGRMARFVPCTALGCVELLLRSGIELRGKRVVIVGDSNIVGMPLAMLFRDQGTASVTVIHRSSHSAIDSARNCGRGPSSYHMPHRVVHDTTVSMEDGHDDPPHPYQVTYSCPDDARVNDMFTYDDVQSMASVTRTADVLVVAVGCPELVTASWIKPGAIILDVGINSKESFVHGTAPLYQQLAQDDTMHQHIVGDVNFSSVWGKAGCISPVPGGIGPMTVAALLHNTISSAAWRLAKMEKFI